MEPRGMTDADQKPGSARVVNRSLQTLPAQLVKLMADDGTPIYVNKGSVSLIMARGVNRGGSVLYVAGKPIYVVESPDEVAGVL